ncbi:uncharacterized protein TRAVEDRAFT_32532, partial [Trametes versicolor FP-101664 SS1]
MQRAHCSWNPAGACTAAARTFAASHGGHTPRQGLALARRCVRGGLSNTTPHPPALRRVRLSSLGAVWTKYIFVAEDDFVHVNMQSTARNGP